MSAALQDRMSLWEGRKSIRSALRHQDSFNELLAGVKAKLHDALSDGNREALRVALDEADRMEADVSETIQAVVFLAGGPTEVAPTQAAMGGVGGVGTASYPTGLAGAASLKSGRTMHKGSAAAADFAQIMKAQSAMDARKSLRRVGGN